MSCVGRSLSRCITHTVLKLACQLMLGDLSATRRLPGTALVAGGSMMS